LFDNLNIITDNESIKDVMSQISNDINKTNDLRDNDKKALFSYLFEKEQQNYPSAEKFTIEYKKSDHHALIKMLTFRAGIKECVAIKRYNGDKNYTSLDAIKEFTESLISTSDD
jgi:hypothetical protein